MGTAMSLGPSMARSNSMFLSKIAYHLKSRNLGHHLPPSPQTLETGEQRRFFSRISGIWASEVVTSGHFLGLRSPGPWHAGSSRLKRNGGFWCLDRTWIAAKIGWRIQTWLVNWQFPTHFGIILPYPNVVSSTEDAARSAGKNSALDHWISVTINWVNHRSAGRPRSHMW